jgi:hypothetical protein
LSGVFRYILDFLAGKEVGDDSSGLWGRSFEVYCCYVLLTKYTLDETALCCYWLKQFGVDLFEKGAFVCPIKRFIHFAWTAAIDVDF